ncbi:MAG: putative glycoside hydrolase [Actinobacteria bacterium]|nr:putative glycoside hydrolase [Actinomycetota bacterium]
MAHYPRGGSRIFTRRRLRSRLVPRAKITGARVGGGGRSAQPRMRRRRLKLTPRAVWALLGMGTVVFLVVLLALLLNSPPVKGLWPAEGSCVSGSPVRMEVSLRGGVGLEQLTVLLDGQDVTGQAVMEGSLLHLEVPLPDGEHSLEVQVKGKSEASSRFSVDNTPPVLQVDEWELREDGKTVLHGKVEGAQELLLDGHRVKVGPDGAFHLEVDRFERSSVTLVAVDGAGNRRELLVETSPPPEIKGIHVSIWVAADRPFFKKMVELVKKSELNGMQIDVKDESGRVAYPSQVPLGLEVGSPLTRGGVDIERVMDKCWYNDIYPIARIVCFKDPIVASKRPDLAVHSAGGGLWGNGQWLDPYNREVWDYLLGLAQEAARKGFKEIQLDYVRFPSDGNTTTCVYPANDGRPMEETIVAFLGYMREGLKPMGVVLSADVFGLTASDQGSMGIGQDITAMARQLDYLCPMVYPSHYNPGEYKIGNPEANPHDTVYLSLVDFQKKLEGTACKLRPWLQDFSLRINYGVNEVQAQIRACYELGIKEWLLWDPNCTFTEEALQPAQT